MTLSEATRRWQALDARHHLHPFTHHWELARKGARVITRAEGCYVWDSEGNRILDGMSGLWCVQVGHGRERLAAAAYAQMRQLDYYNAFFQCAAPPTIELAAKLASLLPDGMERIVFANSGSEANDAAIKTVWYFWNLMGKPQKKQIISRTLGYHGVGLGSASLTGMRLMHEPFDLPLPGFHHVGDPDPWGLGWGKDPAAFGREAAGWLEAKILELGPENVAAFIGEPEAVLEVLGRPRRRLRQLADPDTQVPSKRRDFVVPHALDRWRQAFLVRRRGSIERHRERLERARHALDRQRQTIGRVQRSQHGCLHLVEE